MKRVLAVAILSVFLAACSQGSLDSKASKAEALLGIGDVDGALTIYRDLAERCPAYERCAEILLRIGDIEADMRARPEEAVAAYGRVIDLFPTKEAGRLALERRARVYEISGDHRGAINDYARLLQYYPNSESFPLYLLRLGETYIEIKNFKQARLELRGLVQSKDIDDRIRQEALFSYAESFFLEGRLGLAEQSYRKLLDEYPDSSLATEARMKIATCQEERGFLGDAKRSLAEVKGEYPNEQVVEERIDAMKHRGKETPPDEVMKFVERAKKAAEEEKQAAASEKKSATKAPKSAPAVQIKK